MSAWQGEFSPLRHRDQWPRQLLSVLCAPSECLCTEHVVNTELEALVRNLLPPLSVLLKANSTELCRKSYACHDMQYLIQDMSYFKLKKKMPNAQSLIEIQTGLGWREP